jgi:tRNA uridine 5-carboxymethylaminomethyl modification enzyme
MPCNPHIGGSSKGHIVREIDCLGGEMGKNTDKTYVQLKMLNTSKGPAVHSLRAQADRKRYQEEMKKRLEETPNLFLKQGEIVNITVENDKVKSVETNVGAIYDVDAVVLATGTYLKGAIHIGEVSYESGPDGVSAANRLSDVLKGLGITINRFKTGTPARINRRSIDFSKMEVEKGDDIIEPFSLENDFDHDDNQMDCYLTYTNEKTHEIIRKNLDRSPLYSGRIHGVGPRYCPSIEDKVVKFNDKERHQIFLEPESLFYDDIYIQGFSTSMPRDIQEQMVHSLPGLEHAEIVKYAYAIEYDAIDSLQLKPSLESKIVENLYTAGQINGTSGYEEAAGQGLIAGINAARKIDGKDPIVLKRNEAYIGVLIDDLVTKGVIDPYRLLTSRAEYRLLLRHDNADIRLMKYGNDIGLISKKQYKKFEKKLQNIEELKELLKTVKITPKEEINKYLESLNSAKLLDSIYLYDLLKRPEIEYKHIERFLDKKYDNDVIEQVVISIKYDGYIAKANKEAEKMLEYERIKLSEDLDYTKVPNLAKEAVQKLNEIKPISIGQAIRISGVNPADISMLLLYLKRNSNE